ncbi:MAG: phosphodiester glycosidase family protein [Clostridia bacterium]|nr:phosphodiester glycosidase family protein [Clostridia bacterium]
MFKKVLAMLTSFAIILPIGVNAKAVYNLADTKNIASGVVLTNLKRLDSAGWQNINIIEADLTNEYVKTKVLSSSSGLNTLETVKNLAEENNTVAAVNGDFFAWNSSDKSKGTAVGTIMNDGKLLSSSSETEGMFTFAIDEFNKIICENIITNITLKAPNGNELTIKHLNKYDSLAEPVIYTSAFGGQTGGSYNNVLEVIIEDDVVTEMRTEQDGVIVPENGYVIRHLPEFNPFLNENLVVGDKVEIKFEANFDLSEFVTMTGGGTMLVTQGMPAKITHNVSGANPRTVIACDQTRTKLYLITVDGRQSNAKGYTLSQLTEFLVEIGMYDAMNLDGGGSTTMVAKQKDYQNVINVPSDGGQRKVATAIGILSNAPKGSAMTKFEIEVSDDNVFSGTTRTFSIKNPVDEYGNQFDGEIPEVNFKIQNGFGFFDGNVLHATKSGENVKVYASYNGYTAETEIDILDSIFSLTVAPSHFSIKDFNNPQFKVIAQDKKGVCATVEPSDVNISKINDYEKTVSVLDKKTNIYFSDIVFEFENDEFAADKYPEQSVASVSTDYNNFKSKFGSGKLKYDFSNVPADKSAAAYLKLKSPVAVSGKRKLGLWVYSPTVLNQWLRAEFKDKNGNIFRQTLLENIDFSGWKYVTFDVPEGAFELTQFYIVQNDLSEKSQGYVLFDSLSEAKHTFESEVINLNKSNPTGGDFSFNVTANMPQANTFLSKVLAANVATGLKNSDYVFSLKNYDFYGIDEIKTNGYSSFEKENSLFITLNNSNGFTSAAQWLKFDNDTSKDFKNLFIFLNESHNLIKNRYEFIMFKKKIEDISKKANVYVFYPDMHTNMYYESGAKFISVGNLETQSPWSAIKLLDTLLIPKVTVTDNNVDISFVSLR